MDQHSPKCGVPISTNALYCDCGWRTVDTSQPRSPAIHRFVIPMVIVGMLGAIVFGFIWASIFMVMVMGSRMHGFPIDELVQQTSIVAFVGFVFGAGVVLLYRAVKKT